MLHLNLQYPIFGSEILCPHCSQTIIAITLTDSYLCDRHGAFEADSGNSTLVHVTTGRHWRQWANQWYRQHTHPDGIRFEIHEALDNLYTEGYRATKVIIAHRYKEIIISYLQNGGNTKQGEPKIYGLPVEFTSPVDNDPYWNVVNFKLEKEEGIQKRQPYFRIFE
jgi:uncharacterized protein (TIGR02652 family)